MSHQPVAQYARRRYEADNLISGNRESVAKCAMVRQRSMSKRPSPRAARMTSSRSNLRSNSKDQQPGFVAICASVICSLTCSILARTVNSIIPARKLLRQESSAPVGRITVKRSYKDGRFGQPPLSWKHWSAPMFSQRAAVAASCHDPHGHNCPRTRHHSGTKISQTLCAQVATRGSPDRVRRHGHTHHP